MKRMSVPLGHLLNLWRVRANYVYIYLALYTFTFTYIYTPLYHHNM